MTDPHNRRHETASDVGRGHRRFAHLTREDVDVLDILAATRGRAAAREFERLVRSQHTSDQAFRREITVETDLGVDLDVILGLRAARFINGAGGGAARHRGAPPD